MQAVVIGSGISGLLTAEVLRKHFDQVLVVERDSPKSAWEQSAVDMVKDKRARHGVTQYNHIHGMLAQGLASANSIFEGRYLPALLDAGAGLLDAYTAIKFVSPKYGAWKPNPAAAARQPVHSALGTRHLFETTARKLVAESGNVSFKYGVKAAGLVFGGGGGDGATGADMGAGNKPVVTGVLLADGSTLPADLVVDCSGRHSSMPDWLAGAGFGRPRMSRVSAGCGYASWFVKLSPEVEQELAGVSAVYFLAEPPHNTMGLLTRVEHGAWMAAVGGYQGRHPPMKDDHLINFAVQEVWHRAVGQLLQGSTQLAPASRFFGVVNTWQHYEEMTLPLGLLVLADSICSFNPVHGQGMTVAALQVAALDQLLAQRRAARVTDQQRSQGSIRDGTETSGSGTVSRQWLSGLSEQLLQTVLPTIQSAWDLAAGNDLKFEGAVSTDPPGTGSAAFVGRFMQRYMSSVFELAAKDAVVNEALVRVVHMLDEPRTLLRPAVVGRVLLHQLTGAA